MKGLISDAAGVGQVRWSVVWATRRRRRRQRSRSWSRSTYLATNLASRMTSLLLCTSCVLVWGTLKTHEWPGNKYY